MKLISICLCLTLLTGCSLFPQPGESVVKYVLDPVKSNTMSFSGRHSQIVVEVPTLYPPLDNARVAVKPTPQQMDYLADVEWADRLGGLIQDSIIYSLENTERFKMVGRPADGATADYALRLEVRKFYIDDITATKGGVATIEYRVDLMTFPGREVISSRSIEKRVRCPVDGVDGLMQTLNTAQIQATKDLISWLFTALSQKGKKHDAQTSN